MNISATVTAPGLAPHAQGRIDAQRALDYAARCGEALPAGSGADGAFKLWEYSPAVKLEGDALDAYTDGWYEVAYKALV